METNTSVSTNPKVFNNKKKQTKKNVGNSESEIFY